MNIVIIGAGDIGLHLAMIFSQVDYGTVLVDTNPHKLELAARNLDIATRLGSGTDWELLEELMELAPDLFIALTNDDETNLVACTIAKNLGYPQTIARVRHNTYLNPTRLNFEKLFSVDHLIGPERLTADAIANMILIPSSIETENFSHGAVQMRTLKIPPKWRKGNIPLSRRGELELPEQAMVGLIRRHSPSLKNGKASLIFPHGTDTIHAGDEVTVIGETDTVRELHKCFDIPTKLPKSVMIVGGSLIGINLAQLLQEKGVRIRIIEQDFDKCTRLSELLPYCTVIQHDGCDCRFLQSERIGNTDVFVACTRNDEVNFLAANVAHDLGCEKVIISLSDINFLPLIARFGIHQAASPRLYAANRILSIARERTIASMVSMYDNQAEIMEIKVSIDSKITGIPIRQLGPQFPKDFLIAFIQSRGRIFIADGTRVLSPGDTVIVISHPKHLNEIKKLF